MKPHQNTGTEKRLILSIGLTLVIFFVQVVGGIWTGSLALLSDAAHIFMDVFALVLSYAALRISARPADDEHTFGWHRVEVLAALINGLSLLVISVGIWREAYLRWQAPGEIRGIEMLIIAVVGLIFNLVVAKILGGHTHTDHTHADGGTHAHVHTAGEQDLNVQSAFLHVVGDAISSVGVILAAVVISLTGWTWIDPLISALIGGIILFGSYRVLRGALHILVEGAPQGLNRKEIAGALLAVPGVGAVHDLHVWSLCSGRSALSAHVVMANGREPEKNNVLLSQLNELLLHRFGIGHTTLQIEDTPCSQPGTCD